MQSLADLVWNMHNVRGGQNSVSTGGQFSVVISTFLLDRLSSYVKWSRAAGLAMSLDIIQCFPVTISSFF